MSTLTVTKNYADGTVLFASDFDDMLNDIEELFNETKLSSSNIQTGGVTASLVLANSSISTAKITSNCITTEKLAAASMSTDNIAALAVTSAKLADDTISSANLADSCVTTAKIADASVTNLNREDTGIAAESAIVTGGYIDDTTDVTLTSVSIVATGRPVRLVVQSASTNARSLNISAYLNVNMINTGRISIYRNATLISYQTISAVQEGVSISIASISHIDQPAADTYTYYLKAKVTDGDSGMNFGETPAIQLVAVEI